MWPGRASYDRRVQRLDVGFPSGEETCAAWLYLPDGDGRVPGVVLAHGWTGVREQRLDAYAERFAGAGLAALVFDYRHFGASSGEPRQLLDITRQLADWAAAIAFVRSRAEIDPGRVALWGTSFSGGHVIETAARDRQIAAVVAQVPFVDGLRNLPSLGLPRWRCVWSRPACATSSVPPSAGHRTWCRASARRARWR